MNQLRFIREAIYGLKREYGIPGDLYILIDSTSNLETGERIVKKEVFRIKRVILLPRRLYNNVVTLVGGTQKIHHGATTDQSERLIIIDSKDYPKDYTVSKEDYFVINRTRYNVLEVQDFESKLAVLLKVRQIEGELPRQILDVRANTSVNLNSGSTGGL